MGSSRPHVDFAEVKRLVSVPEVLEAFGLLDQFARRGDGLVGACPLPQHKHGPMPNEQQWRADCRDGIWQWYCFGDCRMGGDCIRLVQLLTGFSYAHTRLWFAEHFGGRLSLGKSRKKQGTRKKREACDVLGQTGQSQASLKHSHDSVPEPSPQLKPLRFFLQLERNVPYLLEDRKLKPDTIERYGIGLCSRGLLAGYIAIPIYLPQQPMGENPVGYIGRWAGKDYDEGAGRPRYKFPAEFPRNQVLYGLREALSGTAAELPLVIVEGPFQVFWLYQEAGIAAVATFGANISDEQAVVLAATGRRLVLLFDGDEAGYAGMRRAAAKLITQSYVRCIRLPEGTEPDALSGNELREFISI